MQCAEHCDHGTCAPTVMQCYHVSWLNLKADVLQDRTAEKRKDYVFRRQFYEELSIILGCPGFSGPANQVLQCAEHCHHVSCTYVHHQEEMQCKTPVSPPSSRHGTRSKTAKTACSAAFKCSRCISYTLSQEPKLPDRVGPEPWQECKVMPARYALCTRLIATKHVLHTA